MRRHLTLSTDDSPPKKVPKHLQTRSPAPLSPASPAPAPLSPQSSPSTVLYSSPIRPLTQAQMDAMNWEVVHTPNVRPEPQTDTVVTTPRGSCSCCDNYCPLFNICLRCVAPESINTPLAPGHPNSAMGTCPVCREVVIAATHQCPGKPQLSYNRNLLTEFEK